MDQTLSPTVRASFTPTASEDSIENTVSEDRFLILQPVAMTIPNRHSVYCLDWAEPKKMISYEEFLSHYADHPQKIPLCFDEAPSADAIKQRSNIVTAYSCGLDSWYIIDSYSNDEDFSSKPSLE